MFPIGVIVKQAEMKSDSKSDGSIAVRILLVDDEVDLRIVTSLKLRSAGYEVFEAVDGREVLDRVRSIMPDLILLDLNMPRMNGREFLAEIKKDPRPVPKPPAYPDKSFKYR
jgi:CheY-like chemotaxis protein